MGQRGRLVVRGVEDRVAGPNSDRAYEVSIVRVLPKLDVDGKYRAFIELENEKMESGSWRLLPGMVGKIVLGQE